MAAKLIATKTSSIFLQIVNKPCKSGKFSNELERAVVKIIRDLKVDVKSLNNYWPISNLLYISKILEKCALVQLRKYLLENDLYYWQNQVTDKVIVAKQKIFVCLVILLKKLEKGNIVALLLLDMSAAFDTSGS